MILTQLSTLTTLTHTEKALAAYILEHPDQVPDMSTMDLARVSLTSKATIVRLCQKLGLSGFQEFKLKLVAELSQNQRISQILENEPITGESSYGDIIQVLPGLYDKAITNTRLTFNKNEMIRINNFLQNAESIEIYGTGISYLLAQSAAFKFATLGVECSAYESINEHFLASRRNMKTIAF